MSRLAEDVTSAVNVAGYAKPLGGVLRAAVPRSTRRKRAMSSIERRMRALLGEAAAGDGAEAFIEQTKALLKLKPPLGEASRGEGPHATYTDFQDQCDAAFLAAFADVMASKGFRTKINAGEPLYAEFKNAEFEGMTQLIAASMNDIEAHVAIKSVAGGKKQFYKRSFKMKALSPVMLADVVLKDWLGKPGTTRAGDI